MSLISDVTDLLQELNCPLLFNNAQLQTVDLNSISLNTFSKLINWLSLQLRFFANIDSIVNVINDDTDLPSLNIELNSLLKEVDSIYADKISLVTIDDRLALLHSVCGDLLAAQLQYIRSSSSTAKDDEDARQLSTQELNPKKDLKIINNCLAVVGETSDAKEYFRQAKEKLSKIVSLKLLEEDSLLLPDNTKTLTTEQWNELKRLNETFRREYTLRRETLLRRADFTIKSFTWKATTTTSDTSNEEEKNQNTKQQLQQLYRQHRDRLSATPGVTLAHALAARSSDCNALINEVISVNHVNCIIGVPCVDGKANQGAQQRLQLHKYLIGNVPDRGGRPTEQPTPARETFTQQQQQRDHRGRGGGGGRGRGGGGGGGGGGHHQQQRQQYQQQGGGGGGHRQQRAAIPEQTNRIQHAGWQGGGGGGGGGGGYYDNNYRQDRQQNDYAQYQSGYQRFSGGGGGGGYQHQHQQQQGGYYDDNNYGYQHQQQQSHHHHRGRGRGGGGGGRHHHNNNRYY